LFYTVLFGSFAKSSTVPGTVASFADLYTHKYINIDLFCMRGLLQPATAANRSGWRRLWRRLSSSSSEDRAKVARQYSESRSFTVRQMLGTQKSLTVPSSTPLNEAARTMVLEEVGSLMVTHPDTGALMGILTERDYLRHAGGKRNAKRADALVVADVMTTDVVTVTADTALSACVSLMAKKQFRHLPVVDGEKLVGMIGSRNLLAQFLDYHELQVSHLETFLPHKVW
jgi:CBS domain-containing protein